MNYILPYPYGVDYYVQKAQNRLFEYLKSRWGVTDSTYNCFGRALRTRVKDGYIPLFFDPNKNTYVDSFGNNSQGGLFFEDRLAAMSFFGLTDPIKKESNCDHVAKMHLIFFVDLTKITPGGISNA